MRSKMFSGPIMPRITECLAQRQEVAPEEVEEVKNIKNMEGKTKSAMQRLRAEEKNPAHPATALASVLAHAAQVSPIFTAKN